MDIRGRERTDIKGRERMAMIGEGEASYDSAKHDVVDVVTCVCCARLLVAIYHSCCMVFSWLHLFGPIE